MAEFSESYSNAFPAESVEACRGDYRRLPYDPQREYFAFIDPASLSLSATAKFNDEMTLAIGHIEGETIVIDLVEAWSAEVDGQRVTPDDAIAEIIQICKQYKVRDIQADKFGAGWIEHKLSEFRFVPCPLIKSDLYLGLLESINNGKIKLPNDPVPIAQMKLLERRRGRYGKDRIDTDKHDDRCNVCAGVAFMAKEKMKNTSKPLSLADVQPLGQPRRFREEIENNTRIAYKYSAFGGRGTIKDFGR